MKKSLEKSEARYRELVEQTRLRKALKESEERFRNLFQHMIDGVAIYRAVDDGADFEFIDINDAGAAISGVSRNEIVGKRLKAVFPSAEAFGLPPVFREVHRTGKPQTHPIPRFLPKN